MGTHTINIPRWTPPLTNAWRGRHWGKAHRLRKAATNMIAGYATIDRVPRATGKRRVAVRVSLPPRAKQPDRDAYDKLLLDSLKQCGLLIDDSERGLEGRVEVTFERGTADDWGTTITLTDVEDA